jgi:hypothetical protein
MKKLTVGSLQVLVDDEDYKECAKHKWYYSENKRYPQTIIDFQEIGLPRFIMQLHHYSPVFNLLDETGTFSKSNIGVMGVRCYPRSKKSIIKIKEMNLENLTRTPCYLVSAYLESGYAFYLKPTSVEAWGKEYMIDPFTKKPFIIRVDKEDVPTIEDKIWKIASYSACTKLCPVTEVQGKTTALHRLIIGAKNKTRHRMVDGDFFNAQRDNIIKCVPTKVRYKYVAQNR